MALAARVREGRGLEYLRKLPEGRNCYRKAQHFGTWPQDDTKGKNKARLRTCVLALALGLSLSLAQHDNWEPRFWSEVPRFKPILKCICFAAFGNIS